MNREKLREAIKVYSTKNRYAQPRGFEIIVKEDWTEYRYQEFLREYRLEVSMGSAQVLSDSMIESDRGDLLNQLKQDVEDSIVEFFYSDLLSTLREIRHAAYNNESRKVIELTSKLESEILGR